MIESNVLKTNDKFIPDNNLENINYFLNHVKESVPSIISSIDSLSKTQDVNEKILIIDNLINLYTPLSEKVTLFYNEERKKRDIDNNSVNYLNLLHRFKNEIINPPFILELIKQDLLDGEDFLDFSLNVVKSSVLRWESLSNNIVNLENSNLKLEKIDIFKTVKDSININLVNAKNKNIDIKLDESIDYKITADYLQFQTVLCGIIENAIKFTPTGGNINVSVNNIQGIIEIKIKDNGIGIPENVRNLLLKNLVNSSVGTSGEMGTGTGLLIYSIIMKRMNGDIKVESDGEGKGSTFIITIPEVKE